MIDNEKEKGNSLGSQELLFKRPYIWAITITITLLNFLITYNLQNINWQYAYYFSIDVLTTYLVIEFYAFGIGVLNKRLPLNKDLIKRIIYQLSFHTLSVIIFNIILNELFDHLFFKGTRLSLSFNFYTKDIFLALIFVLFFHVLYFGLYFMSNQNFKGIKSDTIKVIDGMAFKLIKISDIILIYTLFGNTYVIDTHYKKYTSDVTLKDLEKKLSNEYFRANRKFIVSKDAVHSYKSSTNGKIELTIVIKDLFDLPEVIIISRDRASSFRSWIK